MKNTKHLLARSKFYLIAAICWTFVIAILCLVSFKKLPSVDVKSADKYVHALFHFGFTILWYLYFKMQNGGKWLLKIFLFSLAYGATIEIMQGLFTETRQADLHDIAANCSGSLIAVLVIILYDKLFKVKHSI